MLKSNEDRKKRGNIFKREANILANCEKIIETKNISTSNLLKEFTTLTKEYKRILKNFIKGKNTSPYKKVSWEPE